MAFPSSLDVFPSTLPTQARIGHSSLHNQISTAVRALEEAVGITGTTDASSLRFKIISPLSIDPGHKHTHVNIIGLGTSATVDIGTTANKIIALDSSAKLPAVDGSQLINLPTDFGRGDIFGPGSGTTLNNEIVLFGVDSNHIKGSGVLWSAVATVIGNSHTHSNYALIESLVDNGLGDKVLADDGTYKTINSAVWGNITGSLSSQTDLVNALLAKVSTSTTVNGKALSSNVTLSTADVLASVNKRYVTDADLLVIAAQSGTNTGDETDSTIKTKLGITILSGSNTGDQTTITGNAGTATALQTARTIAGSSFDGTSNININYSNIQGIPTLGTAAAKNIPAAGNASITEVVYGTDTRLTDSRNASDVYSWAKAATKPTYTYSEVGAEAALGFTPENVSNKVTSISGSSTDTQYPSAKLLYDQLAGKQETLSSGTNIKTINGSSILGAGNLVIGGGSFSWGSTISGTSGSGITTTISDSADLGTIGSKYIVGNTQTNAVTVIDIDTGTNTDSALTKAINIKARNAKEFVAGITIDMNGSTGRGIYMSAVGASRRSEMLAIDTGHFGTLASMNYPNVVDFTSQREQQAAASITDLYNVQRLWRWNNVNNAGGTMNANGSVLLLKNETYQTSGTMNDNVDVLVIEQSENSKGAGIYALIPNSRVASTDPFINIVLDNTQTNASTLMKLDTGTSARDHTGMYIKMNSTGALNYGLNIQNFKADGIALNIATSGNCTTQYSGVIIVDGSNTNSDYSQTLLYFANKNNVGAGYNSGIYIANSSAELDISSNKGSAIGITQTGAGGTALSIYGYDNVNSNTNGLLNLTLSNTQSAATTIVKIDMGTSTVANKGLSITNASNSGGAAIGANINMGATGTGVGLNIESSVLGGFVGALLNVRHQAIGTLTQQFGSASSNLISDVRFHNGATTVSETLNTLFIDRQGYTDNASANLTEAGTVLWIRNYTVNSAGTYTDTVNVLKIDQGALSKGAGIYAAIPSSRVASTDPFINIVLGNTQTQVSTLASFDLGTSAVANKGVVIKNYAVSAGATIGQSIDMGTDGTGIGLEIKGNAKGGFMGTLLNISHTSSGTLTAQTGSSYSNIITETRSHSGATTVSETLNTIFIDRQSHVNNASAVLTENGSTMWIRNYSTQTLGTLTDNVYVLKVDQSSLATKSCLYLATDGSDKDAIQFDAGYTTSTAPTGASKYIYIRIGTAQYKILAQAS